MEAVRKSVPKGALSEIYQGPPVLVSLDTTTRHTRVAVGDMASSVDLHVGVSWRGSDVAG